MKIRVDTRKDDPTWIEYNRATHRIDADGRLIIRYDDGTVAAIFRNWEFVRFYEDD